MPFLSVFCSRIGQLVAQIGAAEKLPVLQLLHIGRQFRGYQCMLGHAGVAAAAIVPAPAKKVVRYMVITVAVKILLNACNISF